MEKQKNIEDYLKSGEKLSFGQQICLVIRLSIPAILAEMTSTVMQYIDAAMVGNMGAKASAAIGLVSSSSWLLGGLCISAATGFSVQVAHFAGAGQKEEAKNVFRQSMMFALVFGVLLSLTGILISPALPVWLGGKEEIIPDASRYFFIFSCALPAVQFRQLAGSMLQCSGDMKTPSMLNIIMCVLDVLFNFLLIFPTRRIHFGEFQITVAGAGLGVSGAALGTALSEVVIAVCMMWTACVKSDFLKLTQRVKKRQKAAYYKKAAKISLPIAFEHVIYAGRRLLLRILPRRWERWRLRPIPWR